SSAEPRRLGAFWSEALDWPEQLTPDGFMQMLWDAGLDRAEYDAYYAAVSPDGSRPRLLFQRREKSRPASYPLHLDLLAHDRKRESEPSGAAGATSEQTRTASHGTWK